MDPRALDDYITGGWGTRQIDQREEELYGRMYTALTDYVNYVCVKNGNFEEAMSDEEMDDMEDLITEVLDKIIAGTDPKG